MRIPTWDESREQFERSDAGRAFYNPVLNPSGYVTQQAILAAGGPQIGPQVGPQIGARISGRGQKEVPISIAMANAPDILKARDAEIERGMARARRELYEDPEVQRVAKMREDLARGYSSQALGGLREEARGQIQGARQSYLDQMRGNLAKAGVGGARGAAMIAGANRKFMGDIQRSEAAQQALQEDAVRKGQAALEDFLMRRKFGVLGSGLAEASLGAQERAGAQANALLGRQEPKGFLSQLFGDLI